jgi:xanthine dehydrogenase accessory factor
MAELPVRLDNSLEILLASGNPGRPAVLATIVSTAGSTYRKAGARMLINDDDSHSGLLTGGCLEGDLASHAASVAASGRPLAVEYDMRGPDDALFGIGAGCEGAMRILLEPAAPGSAALAALASARDAGRRGECTTLVTVHAGEGGALGTHIDSADLPSGLRAAVEQARRERRSVVVDAREAAALGEQSLRAFVQWLPPPPHIVICGGGDDAVPVAALAGNLGWHVTVVDHRPRYADADRFPGANVVCADADDLANAVDLDRCHAALVMSHHLVADGRYLAALAGAPGPGYVGLLGPRARRERLLDGDSDAATLRRGLAGRLRGPVGLDLGAITPEAIALSIVAELHAHLADRTAAPPPLLA